MNELIKIKFRIKINKLRKKDWQLGLFLNREHFSTEYNSKGKKEIVERYIYICLFKINISIGFLLR